MTTLVLNGNQKSDERIWDVISFEDGEVSVPAGGRYYVRQAGDDVEVIDTETETVCYCTIVDDD